MGVLRVVGEVTSVATEQPGPIGTDPAAPHRTAPAIDDRRVELVGPEAGPLHSSAQDPAVIHDRFGMARHARAAEVLRRLPRGSANLEARGEGLPVLRVPASQSGVLAMLLEGALHGVGGFVPTSSPTLDPGEQERSLGILRVGGAVAAQRGFPRFELSRPRQQSSPRSQRSGRLGPPLHDLAPRFRGAGEVPRPLEGPRPHLRERAAVGEERHETRALGKDFGGASQLHAEIDPGRRRVHVRRSIRDRRRQRGPRLLPPAELEEAIAVVDLRDEVPGVVVQVDLVEGSGVLEALVPVRVPRVLVRNSRLLRGETSPEHEPHHGREPPGSIQSSHHAEDCHLPGSRPRAARVRGETDPGPILAGGSPSAPGNPGIFARPPHPSQKRFASATATRSAIRISTASPEEGCSGRERRRPLRIHRIGMRSRPATSNSGETGAHFVRHGVPRPRRGSVSPSPPRATASGERTV